MDLSLSFLFMTRDVLRFILEDLAGVIDLLLVWDLSLLPLRVVGFPDLSLLFESRGLLLRSSRF